MYCNRLTRCSYSIIVLTLVIVERDILAFVAAALKWKRRRERRKKTHDNRSALPTIPVT